METATVKLSALRGHELQPEDRRSIADLKSSIENVGGVLVPPIVMPDGEDGSYIILSGHRRVAAAKAQGIKELVVHVVPKDKLEHQVRIITAANVQKPLDDLQRAAMLRTLMREKKIAFRKACVWMDLAQTDGRALVRLLDAPEEVQKAVKKGELAFGTFKRELAPLTNEAMLEALSGGTTRKAVRKSKRKMAKEEAGERVVDDATAILAGLTMARQEIARAVHWLIGAESSAAADVQEALRGVRDAWEVGDGAE